MNNFYASTLGLIILVHSSSASNHSIGSIVSLDNALNEANFSTRLYDNAWGAIWAQDSVLSKLSAKSLPHVWIAAQAESYTCHGIYRIIKRPHYMLQSPICMILSSSKNSELLILGYFELADDGRFKLVHHTVLSRKYSHAHASIFEKMEVYKIDVSLIDELRF